jgi:hypothetical protein
MRTAAYKVDVASDRRRRENVPWHILCYVLKTAAYTDKKDWKQVKE